MSTYVQANFQQPMNNKHWSEHAFIYTIHIYNISINEMLSCARVITIAQSHSHSFYLYMFVFQYVRGCKTMCVCVCVRHGDICYIFHVCYATKFLREKKRRYIRIMINMRPVIWDDENKSEILFIKIMKRTKTPQREWFKDKTHLHRRRH